MKQVYCKEGTLCSKYPLEKKKVIKKVISGGIASIINAILLCWLFAFAFLIFRATLTGKLTPPTLKPGLAGKVILFSFVLIIGARTIYEIFYFRFYFYDCTEKELIIRKGVISRREVVIPFSKIQKVYIDQDFFG